jgi:hypothetical protein
MLPLTSRRLRAALAAPVLAGLILAACGGGDDEAAPAGGAPADDATEAGEPDETPGDETDEVTATTVQVTTRLPADADLDMQDNHPNGTVLIARRVTFHDDRIQVELSVTNGATREIRLSSFGRLTLRDDLGNSYRFSAPPSNPDVRVTAQSSIEGTFVFLGRIHPRASSLTLTTNSTHSNDRSEHSTRPRIVIDGIPVERSGEQ